MSPTKRTTKKTTKRTTKRKKKKTPTKAMLKEVAEVLARHKWVGSTIWMPEASPQSITGASESVEDNGGLAPNPASLNCILPEVPTFVSKLLPNGDTISGFVCRKP